MSHVVLHVWRVPLRRLPLALLRMGLDRLHLRRAGTGGVRPGFWKLLGTGDGRTFDARDADLRTWALLTTWPDRDAALAFEAHRTPRGWRRIATEEWRADLRCLQSRGRWAGRQPFAAQPDAGWTGPVASVTRARIRPSMWSTFWREVPAVVADLDTGGGPVARIGIGEAPVGLQGTFTVWPSADALHAFAHRRAPHRKAIADTRALDWYAEELFARFALTDERGTLFGRPAPIATATPAGSTADA